MLSIILQYFYFMLPAYFANMAPVIVKNIFNNLEFPLDFNKKIKNKPIFGKNKTFRGLIFGILFAVIIAYLQFLFYNNNLFVNISIVNYSDWLLIGLLMGFGTIFGDLVESFVKRRMNYESGKSFIPWDQMDFVIGALIFVYPIVKLSLDKIIIILLLSFILHIIANHIAFYTGVRRERW
ncbi:MAG: CDP-2,3-bis-(O-geranylgeranyl)-sn-glycerol synthase [Candidatus Woesearchaeota archaeon]|nr:CDP-2,3-bis-(O-geranylgeranyl)-sn-glycerol synthase [Candidatus Woesearchaeota archaeon]